MRVVSVIIKLINHLSFILLLSDCCSCIKNNVVLDTNSFDGTSRQSPYSQRAISFFPRDDEDNDKYSINYEPQQQQPQYTSAQYSPYSIYSYNRDQQFAGSTDRNPANFRFSNDDQRQESYYTNQNEVIPQPPVRQPNYYYPGQQLQSNYFKKYRRFPPIYNNYYNYNDQGKYEQYVRPSPQQNYQNYYQPAAFENNVNYAGQYDDYYNPKPVPNPNGNFLNQFGLQGGSGNIGGQLTKAIEDISSHDDYQCVPKLLCQMVGNPSRPNNLPSFLTGPGLSTLIAALPSNSPFLNFGRAALLGISGGEHSCHSAYPKCPRNEEDLLFYLNNHRGGFFRFFNGGATFGDDTDSIYHMYGNQNSQTSPNYQNNLNYQNQNYKPQDVQQTFANLATLQNLASAFNQNGGINLSNLGSNIGLLSSLASLMGGYQNKNSNDGVQNSPQANGNGVGDFVGNLLTGLVGGRFTTGRKITKRSIDETESPTKLKRGVTRKRNLDLELINPYESFESKKIKFPKAEEKVIAKLLKVTQNANEIVPDIKPVAQRRILNLNEPQIPVRFETSNKIEDEQRDDFFAKQQQFVFQFVEANRLPKKQVFFPQNVNYDLPTRTTSHGGNAVSYQSILRFPGDNNSDNRNKALKFVEDNIQYIPKPLEYYDTSKMIFPDRTGTGNLRFDNDEFHRPTRFGKIINRPSPSQQPAVNTNQDRYQYYHQYSYVQPTGTSSSLQQSTPTTSSSSRPNYYSYNSLHDQTSVPEPNNNIYVTNGQGVVEYYINNRGEKVYM